MGIGKYDGESIDFLASSLSLKNGSPLVRGYFIVSYDFDMDTDSGTIIAAGNGWVIKDIWVNITEPFEDESGQGFVGDSGDTNGLLDFSYMIMNNLTGWYGYNADERGPYLWDVANKHIIQKVYDSETDVQVIINTISPVGSGTVYLGIVRLI